MKLSTLMLQVLIQELRLAVTYVHKVTQPQMFCPPPPKVTGYTGVRGMNDSPVIPT